MSDTILLQAFFGECFPTIQENEITDPELRAVWISRAKAWHKDKTAGGFHRAVVEFKKLQGLRHYSRETTLRHAHEALKRAGLA